MEFFKYQGTGNDFIMIKDVPQNPSETAIKLCDRHFGIGADGLIYPELSDQADIKFNYYNSDGSVAPMCGNGMRCFVKFLIDEKLIEKKVFVVETLAGLISVIYDEKTQMVTVDLGKPIFKISTPHVLNDIDFLNPISIEIENIRILTYNLFLGTLHTVIYDDGNMDILHIGPKVSDHPFFPQKTNVNFVRVNSYYYQSVQTYERGAGWTLSCGTGTAASAVVSHFLSKVDTSVQSDVLGGKLRVDISDSIKLIGPAVKIASGYMEV